MRRGAIGVHNLNNSVRSDSRRTNTAGDADMASGVIVGQDWATLGTTAGFLWGCIGLCAPSITCWRQAIALAQGWASLLRTRTFTLRDRVISNSRIGAISWFCQLLVPQIGQPASEYQRICVLLSACRRTFFFYYYWQYCPDALRPAG